MEFKSWKKSLIYSAAATGLTINYNKSTVVPIHLDKNLLQQCIGVLGCRQESFPQNYLGLPLSSTKLPASAFSTYIDRTDRFLSSWQAKLLNTMDRAVLINSVLDSQLVYVMSSMQVPPMVIQQIDKRWRAFLWAGDPQAITSAKCLVALQNVCTTKDLGGWASGTLGLKTSACYLSWYTDYTSWTAQPGHSG